MSFTTECGKSFKALSNKYHLKVDKSDSENIFCLKNSTAGLEVIYEKRDSSIFIQLYRLIDGEFPIYKSLHEYDNDLKNRFDVNFLIELRSSKIIASSFANSSIKNVLDEYAFALEKYAADVLAGDFSIFPKLTRLVKKQIKEAKN